MDGVVVVGCEVVSVGLVDLGIMVLELNFSFGRCFCSELGKVKEWTSSGVFCMVDVTGAF